MANTKLKKLLTLQDLENFYSNKKKSFHFSASDDAEAIVVQVPGTIVFSEDDYDATLGLLPVHLQSCHIGGNRNKSSISEDTMKQCMQSICNRPILGYIHQLSDGSYDFAGHEFFVTDDGELEYEEIAVGTIPESCNAQLIYDDEKDKTYLEVDGYVYEEYTRAADILRTKKQSKVSVELSLLDFSYDAKSRQLSIDKFYFSGVTILGVTRDGNETPIEEGMYGSNIKLKDFSIENNSMFSNETEEMKAKLIEMQESINVLLSRFNINQDSNESVDNYRKEENIQVEDQVLVNEEVVEETTVEMEEVTENTTEVIETESTEEATETVTENESEEPVEETPDVVVEESVEETVEEVVETPEVTEEFVEDGTDDDDDDEDDKENFSKTFELSHDDVRCALYQLLAPYEEANNDWYWIIEVYDNHFVYQGCMGNYFGQKYVKTENDSVAFDGEPYALYSEFLTESERAVLTEMRSSYASLVQFKADTENAELHAQREAILYDAKYSVLAEKDENDAYKNEAYAKLVSEMDNYSLTDLEKELKSVFADHITNGGQFAYAGEKENKSVTKKLFANSDSKKTSRYGNLFNK